MLNGIFVFLIFSSILMAAYTGRMPELSQAIITDGGKAVNLSIGLVGVMSLFLGLMSVAEKAGLLRIIARFLAPVMRRLFPGVPPDHPAMSAMILNIGSNMMGLGNAATPFGIKAIEELDKLNQEKGTATNPMILFLAINTAGLALLPSGVIGMRAALGSENAAAIFFPTWFASGSATIVAVSAAFLLSRLPRFRKTEPAVIVPEATGEGIRIDEAGSEPVLSPWKALLAVFFFVALLVAAILQIVSLSETGSILSIVQAISAYWFLPAIVAAMVLFGWAMGVKVYEQLVEGAKEGFQVAIRIIPFLVAILVGIGMFRAAGGVELLAQVLGPITDRIGMPAEALPVALVRPLSGSAALGVMSEVMTVHGPDSFIGYMVSSLYGSTDTTFYVLAVYFGAVGVKRTRHALPACLLADAAGIVGGVFIVNVLFG